MNFFREGDDLFGKPHLRIQAKIHNGEATFVFPQLEYGNYAVILFHDENGNGDLDHNILRLPAEPMGFSNGFDLSLFSGLPSFEKLQFEFGKKSQPVVIAVE